MILERIGLEENTLIGLEETRGKYRGGNNEKRLGLLNKSRDKGLEFVNQRK